MGFGDTAKKLQTVADTAEKLYTRINELRDQVNTVRQRVDETAERVDRIEADVRDQRALLVAIAESEGIDAERVLADGITDSDTGDGAAGGGATGDDESAGRNPVSDDTPDRSTNEGRTTGVESSQAGERREPDEPATGN